MRNAARAAGGLHTRHSTLMGANTCATVPVQHAFPTFHASQDVQVTALDVLGAIARHVVLAQVDRAHVVHAQHRGCSGRESDVREQVAQEQRITGRKRPCHDLCLARRQRSRNLPLASECNRSVAHEVDPAARRPSSGPVCIAHAIASAYHTWRDVTSDVGCSAHAGRVSETKVARVVQVDQHASTTPEWATPCTE